MQKESNPLIISGDSKFQLYSYKSEEELENLATKYSRDIFGKNTIYIDSKKKITSSKGTSSIPDGFLLDLERNKFYIVEIELSAHDIIRHISGQLDSFKLAMNNNATHMRIAEEFYARIVQDRLKFNIGLAKIQEIIGRQYGIIVVIDSISEKLKEVFELKEKDGTEVLAIPFETFSDSNNNRIYKFTTFTKESLEKESKKWTFKWTTIPVEEHLDKIDNGLKDVFSVLSKQICLMPNVKEKSRKNWITYQTSPLKNFCTVKVLPDCLEVHIKCNNSFRDEKGITKKIERTPSWTFDRVFIVRSREDIENAMQFIRQAYECTCSG